MGNGEKGGLWWRDNRVMKYFVYWYPSSETGSPLERRDGMFLKVFFLYICLNKG